MAIRMPPLRYGPIARTLPCPANFMRAMWMTLPKRHPKMRLSKLSFHPRKSPLAAISLISPPPIPSPFVIKYTRSKNPLTATAPIM